MLTNLIMVDTQEDICEIHAGDRKEGGTYMIGKRPATNECLANLNKRKCLFDWEGVYYM